MSSPPSTSIRDLLRPIVRPHARALVFVGVVSFFGALAEAAVLVIVARVAFALTEATSTISIDVGPLGSFDITIGALLTIAACAAIIRVGLQLIAVRSVARVSTEVLTERRIEIIRLYYDASWDLQARERQGHLQEMLTTQVAQVAQLFEALSTTITAGLSLLALLGTALVAAPAASGLAVVAVAALALGLRPLRTRARAMSAQNAGRGREFATTLTELVDMAREIRLFGVGPEARAWIDEMAKAHGRTTLRTRFLAAAVPAVYQGVAFLCVVGALALVSVLGLTGLASLGGVVLIMLRSLSYGQNLQTSYQQLLSAAPYLENLQVDEDRYRAEAEPSGLTPVERVGRIEFRDVCFEYEPGQPVLRHLGFAIEPGEIVGIVGPSGSGKSSLVQLVLRLREPTSGEIDANGHDLRSLSNEDWYRHVAFVPQEPRLLAGTVAENIKFLRADADQADVERAAKLAHLHDDVCAWVLGYETPVGERGGQLSGGQRQRLCIARALVGDPELVVLDEPTSALDVHSESLVRKTITELAPAKTVIIIAHRLSTLAMCDRIMVLLDGEIQGFDAPATLEASNQFYREALRLSGLR